MVTFSTWHMFIVMLLQCIKQSIANTLQNSILDFQTKIFLSLNANTLINHFCKIQPLWLLQSSGQKVMGKSDHPFALILQTLQTVDTNMHLLHDYQLDQVITQICQAK